MTRADSVVKCLLGIISGDRFIFSQLQGNCKLTSVDIKDLQGVDYDCKFNQNTVHDKIAFSFYRQQSDDS